MLIEVIKAYVPYLGKRGVQRNIPDAEARVHIQLGNVKKIQPKPPRRTYRRRDIKPKVQEPVIEPIVEADKEPSPSEEVVEQAAEDAE